MRKAPVEWAHRQSTLSQLLKFYTIVSRTKLYATTEMRLIQALAV